MKTHVLFAVVLAALILPGAVVAGTIYVDCNSPNDPGTGTQSDPYRHIQDGITNANPGDTVQVADGTYTGSLNKDLDFKGNAITVRSENGAATTTIDCEEAGRGFYFHSGETSASVLVGLTIVNGNVSGDYPQDQGGGILCDWGSAPTISDCVVAANTAGVCGGGISCAHGSSPSITRCTIAGNSAGAHAGGILCDDGSNPTISDCAITENSARSWGAGIGCSVSSPTIRGCVIQGNDPNGFYCHLSAAVMTDSIVSENAADQGAGIFLRNSTARISRCIISGNRARRQGGGVKIEWDGGSTIDNCVIAGNQAPSGGGVYLDTGYPTFINCTITGNVASNAASAGGIACHGPVCATRATLTNCILWGDIPREVLKCSPAELTYCDIEGGWPGEGNIADNPLLNADYQLHSGSPCIDAGTNDVDVSWHDLDGTSRFCDATGALGWDARLTSIFREGDDSVTLVWKRGRIDIGAQEYPLDETAETFTVEARIGMGAEWTPVFTGNVGHWTDTSAAALVKRFYRVSTADLGVPPTASKKRPVTAIPGAISASQRERPRRR